MGLLLGMTACNRASLVGTWIEPADDSSVFGEYGLKLNSDGTIEPINMGYREYQTWEKVDDMLILKGRYTAPTLVISLIHCGLTNSQKIVWC